MDSSENKKTRALICLGLAIATFAVYGRVAGFDFVNYDDPDYVTENPMVRDGLTLKGVLWAFTHTYASNWHPLTWISLMLDCQVFGLHHPGGFHLVNVALHTANSVLLFLLLHRMTGAQWRSAVVATLFALHPLHVESVAWISERKDVLSTFFGLLALLAYVRYTEEFKVQSSKFKVWHGLALFLFALGLMAKPMLVTLPFIILLLEFWPLQRVENTGWRTFFTPQFGKLVFEKWPWFALCIASCAVTIYAQATGGALLKSEYFPFHLRVENALSSYFLYVTKACWPARLAIFYPLQPGQSVEFLLVAAAFLLLISLAVLLVMKRCPALLVGWFWFIGTLVPVIGFVQVGGQAMADRYTYLPLIGLFIAVVWALSALVSRSKAAVALGAAAGIVVLGSFAALTVVQLQYWQNSIALFVHALAVTRNNAVANNDLGTALAALGRRDEALSHYAEAVRIDPGRARFQNNLATALVRAGQTNAAVEHYLAAIDIDPRFAEAHSNLGAIFLAQHHFTEAIANLGEAARLDPANSEVRNNLGGAFLSAGRPDDALEQYADALRLNPTNASARLNAGLALLKKGRSDDALNQFDQAVRLDPGSAEARYELGRQLFLRRQFQSAREQLSQAASLKPNDASTEFYLGLTCLEVGDLESGLKHLADAEQLRPQWAAPFNTHAWVLATAEDDKVRNGQEALRLAQRAADLSSREQPTILHTLAAAYAATGQFDKAMATAQEAIQSAESLGQSNLAPTIQQELDLYRSGHPLRHAGFDDN